MLYFRPRMVFFKSQILFQLESSGVEGVFLNISLCGNLIQGVNIKHQVIWHLGPGLLFLNFKLCGRSLSVYSFLNINLFQGFYSQTSKLCDNLVQG